MLGTGYKCDGPNCGTEAVGDIATPPHGWVTIREREANPFAEDYSVTREFCSFVCLSTYTVGRAADEIEASA